MLCCSLPLYVSVVITCWLIYDADPSFSYKELGFTALANTPVTAKKNSGNYYTLADAREGEFDLRKEEETADTN